jgi:ribose 5-phosphate isomerase A
MQSGASSSGPETFKRAAAEAAAGWIEDGMVVGLGTGSTVRHLLDVVAERIVSGSLRNIVGVPTSVDTARRSASLGIPLRGLESHPEIDVTIDGADEVDPDLQLIKGLGGALLREKIVASASRRLVIMVDESKRVSRLGTRAPLPVEVDPFAAAVLPGFFRSLGSEPTLRLSSGGGALTTDGGHLVYDCRFPDGIDDPHRLEFELCTRPGVVGTGLFLDMADVVIVAGSAGVEVIRRQPGVGR